MIKMNYYLHGNNVVSTADMLRGCAASLTRVADSIDKPNEFLALLTDVFDIVTREKVADKIEMLSRNLRECAEDLRDDVLDERPLSR